MAEGIWIRMLLTFSGMKNKVGVEGVAGGF